MNFDNPSIRRRRLPWWVVVGVLTGVVMVYTAFWFVLALTAHEQVTYWVEQQREKGFAVRYDTMKSTGFPFSIKVEISSPGFGAPNVKQPWGWEGAHVSLFLKPWDMETIRVVTTGQQMLAFPLNGRTETFTGEIGRAEAEISFSNDTPQSIRIALKGLDLKPQAPSSGKINIVMGDIDLDQNARDTGDHLSPSWTLAAVAQQVSLPWLKASPLGNEVQHATINGRVLGVIEKGPLIESLEDWRDNGGTVELAKLNVQNGPLKINTNGTLALDGQLQLIGALTAHIEGFFETVDALKRLNVVSPRDAITAKMVLGVLARKPTGGGPATLNAALTLQEGRLYAGPVGLLKIPEIDWRSIGN